jgi:phosphoribosylformylglycinamidine (FGAM) synthase PurS component
MTCYVISICVVRQSTQDISIFTQKTVKTVKTTKYFYFYQQKKKEKPNQRLDKFCRRKMYFCVILTLLWKMFSSEMRNDKTDGKWVMLLFLSPPGWCCWCVRVKELFFQENSLLETCVGVICFFFISQKTQAKG